MTLLQNIAHRTRRASFLTAKNLYWRLHAIPPEQKRYVFVAGVQRSGTNMLMDILEKSWLIDAYHESDERAFDNYKMREVPVIEKLATASPYPVFAIKSLFELQDLPELMVHFSPAKTLWIIRDHNDTVNSTIKSFHHDLSPLMIRVVLDNSPEWLGAGMSEDTRYLVENLVTTQIRDEDAAALQWYMRNILFFELGFDKRPDVLALSYEKLVTRPEAEIRRICEFIDIPYAHRLSKGIFSSSIGKRGKPQVSDQIDRLCAGLKERFQPLTST